MAIKTIGYVRVSTDEQAREGVSLASQKAKIRAYAELKDLDLMEIIEDAGISAKNLKRPGVQRVLGMARKKEIDAIIVYKLDRMFRSTVDALETTRRFDKWCVSFHSIQETLDTQSAMGKFFFTLTAALAEMERQLIGERTRCALQHKKQNGEKTGGDIPFGYDLDATGVLIMNPREQGAVSMIVDLRASGASLRAICSNLETGGHRTKRGGNKWHPQTVKQILDRVAA
ncbi:recombinase family protein [Thermodesulfobacteriota bacterium]